MAVEFHPEKVRDIAKGACKKFLNRAGGYLRMTAKRSIRKKKKPSVAGSPPASHTGALKNFIRFSVSDDARRVVVGPQKLSGKMFDQPSVLEMGGVSGFVRNGAVKNIRIQPRPFMRPALQNTISKIDTFWKVRR